MGDYALYKVLHAYAPANEENALHVQRDDVLEIQIQSPITKTKYPNRSKLYAYNRRTGQQGYVPVAIVKLLGSEVNNTIHHPSAIGVEASYGTIVERLEDTPRADVHRLKEFYTATPIFCAHCKDYIWGTGVVGEECLGNTNLSLFSLYFLLLLVHNTSEILAQ